MKKILRSIINIDGSIGKEDLRRNLFYIAESELEFLQKEDEQIWEFIYDYAMGYSESPSMNSVRDYFEDEHNFEVLDRLDEIEALGDNYYTKSDFENLVRDKLKNQYERKTQHLFKEAAHILTDGKTEGTGSNKTHYKGHQDALRYVLEEADNLMSAGDGMEFRSDITKDADKMRKKFRNTINNVQNAWGRGTGLDPIDKTCRGVKPGELWLHAGFTSELKTTFALNWAYKQAFVFGYNVYYLSLEMNVEQIRDIIYVMHSSHPKFKKQGYESLDYRKVRDGVDDQGNKITKEEKDFYYKVIDDVEKNSGDKYGHFEVECPKKENSTIPQIKNRMEMYHQSTPIHIAFLDYFGLVQPHRNLGSYYQELNAIIREAKQMCMNFNNGEKLPLVALHQINRQGKKEAEKNNGMYTKRALADANEAERTSDVISYTYLNDDLREQNEVKIGCLKNRDNPIWSPFKARVDFRNRFIYNLIEEDENGNTGFEQFVQ
jgi:replicative DNA helicase